MRLQLLPVILAAAVIALAAPVAAQEIDETGALVDYPMPFPVEGEHWFYDSFWEPRPGGRIHAGIDIFADKGTEVVAVADGVIRLVNSSSITVPAATCCSMVITHRDGWESVYFHLNNDTPGTDDGVGWGIATGLVPGTAVAAGQTIGWVGDSGNAEDTPPHLHFELRNPAGTKVNPFLSLRGGGSGGSGEPEDPLYAGRQVMRVGDEGAHVRRLQEELARLGIGVGAIDGAFGPVTESAVHEFQGQYRLDADGLVGEMTRAALAGLLYTGDSVIGFGGNGDDVAETQRMLGDAGIDPGPVDGNFGPATLKAVLAFQRAKAIAIDGLVGPQTRNVLAGPQ